MCFRGTAFQLLYKLQVRTCFPNLRNKCSDSGCTSFIAYFKRKCYDFITKCRACNKCRRCHNIFLKFCDLPNLLTCSQHVWQSTTFVYNVYKMSNLQTFQHAFRMFHKIKCRPQMFKKCSLKISCKQPYRNMLGARCWLNACRQDANFSTKASISCHSDNINNKFLDGSFDESHSKNTETLY